jgi:hypothetical protein
MGVIIMKKLLKKFFVLTIVATLTIAPTASAYAEVNTSAVSSTYTSTTQNPILYYAEPDGSIKTYLYQPELFIASGQQVAITNEYGGNLWMCPAGKRFLFSISITGQCTGRVYKIDQNGDAHIVLIQYGVQPFTWSFDPSNNNEYYIISLESYSGSNSRVGAFIIANTD